MLKLLLYIILVIIIIILLRYLFKEQFEVLDLNIKPLKYYINNLPFLYQQPELINNVKLNDKINYNIKDNLKNNSLFRKDLENIMIDYDKYNNIKPEYLIREVKQNDNDLLMEYSDYSKIRNNNFLDDFINFNNHINHDSNNVESHIDKINRIRNSKINHKLEGKIAETYDNLVDNHFRNQ